MTPPTRAPGADGLSVTAQGLGCMGMSWAYGATVLSAEHIAHLDQLRPSGARYPDMSWVQSETPGRPTPEAGEEQTPRP